MGTLAGSMRKAYVEKLGEEKWRQRAEAVEEMWEGIKKRIQAIHLPFKKVKVYQDGLPICGKEKEIIDELAKRGSLNHVLVQWLLCQGATLVGTEDPGLLRREYGHLRNIAEARTHQEKETLIRAFEKEAGELLKGRDRVIRDRILATLQPGEIGILFIGLLHKVDELIPLDVEISYLIHRLPLRGSYEMKRVA